MHLLNGYSYQKLASALSLFLVPFFILLNPVLAKDKKQASVIDDYQKKVEHLNLQFARALEKEDVQAIIQYYAADATSMPEYHSTLYNVTAIASYYKRWLSATKDNRYQRSIYSIKIIDGYLLESGTFTHDFTQTGHQPFHYSGKYIHVWRIDKKQALTLVSEIWGSASWFDRSSMPLSSDTAAPVQIIPVKPAEKLLADSIIDNNAEVARLVKERNGPAFSAFYTDDAIYMPYYTPMVIGKDSIHSYYVKHEDPAVTIDDVQINISRILPAGDFTLVNGFYNVKWRAGGNSGLVTGKSINIWKREKDGKLRLYWQMTNHD
ncbi:MAG: YybH family protein [Pseudobacter sp.]|uniref:YybH family protein n=1 Tax=Pseudobacter sp. TaxID=2045420 RepID=UPI003F816EAF